jgi:hypothetical protein
VRLANKLCKCTCNTMSNKACCSSTFYIFSYIPTPNPSGLSEFVLRVRPPNTSITSPLFVEFVEKCTSFKFSTAVTRRVRRRKSATFPWRPSHHGRLRDSLIYTVRRLINIVSVYRRAFRPDRDY